MPDIAVDKAYLVALFLETLFYGIFAVVLAFCMDILVTKRRGRVPWRIVVPPIFMFLLSSVHVSIVLRRNIEGFIDRANTPGGAAKYFMEVSNPLNVTNQFIYAINNIIGDSIVIWRCYVVWDHNWKMVVAPILLLLATTVTSLNAAYQFSQATQGVFTPALAVWGKAFFCTTLVTNLLVTSLIATRIWWVARKLAQASAKQQTSKQRYWSLLFLIVESGMIYSAFLLVELILYASQTNAVYILFDCTAQVTGIVPTLIIVLVGLGMTKDMTTVLGTQASIHFRHSPGLRLSLHDTTFDPQSVSTAEFQGTDAVTPGRESNSKTLDMYPLAESTSGSSRNGTQDKKEEYKPWRDHKRAKDKEVG